MLLYEPFKVQLGQVELKQDCEKLKEYSLKLKEKTPGRKVSNIVGWQSEDLTTDKKTKPLMDEIIVKTNEYAKIYNFKKPLKLWNFWININSTGSRNMMHVHPGSPVSGVFYIEAPEGSGVLSFTRGEDLLQYHFENVCKQPNNLISDKFFMKPKTNSLVLFPGYLKHEVETNFTKYDRISLSFNTIF